MAEPARAKSGVIRALALVAALAPTLAHADAVFDHPADRDRLERELAPALERLRTATALTGEYAQRRRVQGLPRPLRSAGSFLVVRDTGVRWETREPFESELVITADGITQRDLGGTPRHLTADAQPGLRAIAETFLSLLVLDLDALLDRFDAFARSEDGAWTLGLRPRAHGIAGVREIVIQGRFTPEYVRLVDASADRTEIEMSRVRTHDGRSGAALRERLTGG